ncbi:MAG TPA: shikimate kinase [Dehalococcoidales bacterium]|nr:shikimate kinase [Dehalococcoidales bacterium]
MKTSIALIGFMGMGKTVVGKLLAEKLGKEFIELDAIIEKKAGRSIPEIFRKDGEIGFRELEIAVTKDVAKEMNAVIACGGGIVLNTINIDRLRKECIIICLAASPQVIIKRTSGDTGERPLLAVPDRARQIKELLKFRKPFYERSADITINTSRISAESVVESVMEKLEDYESQH